MKNLLSIILSILVVGSIVYAETPGGINLTQGGLGITTVSPGAIIVGSNSLRVTSTTSPTVAYITATSTTATSTFKGSLFFLNAQGTSVSASASSFTTLCLTGDVCRTTWPSGGGGGNNPLWATSTTDALAIYPAGGTGIGIGTTSPSSMLTVSATSTLSNLGLFRVESASTTNNTNATTTAFTILDDGRIGIGTTTPQGLFTINVQTKIATNTPMFMIASSTGAASQYPLIVFEDASVGIGSLTARPAQASNSYLLVGNPSNKTNIARFLSFTGGNSMILTNAGALSVTGNITASSQNISGGVFIASGSNSVQFQGTKAIGDTANYATWSKTNQLGAGFYFTSLGFLGISSTTPAGYLSAVSTSTTGSYPVMLLATSTGLATTTVFIVNSNGATTIGGGVPTANMNLTVDGRVTLRGLTSSGSAQTSAICGTTATGGELIAGSVACLVSARRFKTDIQPLDVGLSDLLKLDPVSYFKKVPLDKEDSKRQMGFIADDVAKISPQLNEMLVTYNSTGGVQTFRYEQFTALLTKSIQELNTKVDNLSIGKVARSAEENYQWIVIGLLALWIIRLELKKK